MSKQDADAFDLFCKVVDLDPYARTTFLNEACGDDTNIRAVVDDLVERHEKIRSVDIAAATVIADVGRATQGFAPSYIGRTIGAYEITDVLGQGGMGDVYRARQADPARDVALKVVRESALTPGIARRFDAEAAILGRLRHPGIAQIIEAGSHEGQRFIAMELVPGRPLNHFVREQKLTRRERIELLASLSDAVHYAHQRGVIHRDLKPANILVDDHGVPKILDFGIARLTDDDIRAATIQTQVGDVIGTLTHMAPEQAAGDINAIDTRCDIYALGVIGYELLGGRLPFELDGHTTVSALRLIQESTPPRLGTLDPHLRGDLETIVAKALERDIERRYDSAGELAADLRRFLNHEPISARPASALYQMRKFAQRHRAAVAALAAVVAVLIGATAVSVKFALDERDERVAKDDILEFINRRFLAAIPGLRSSDEPSQLLENAEQYLEDFADHPRVRSELELTFGDTYRILGDFERAEPRLLEAIRLFTELDGPDSERALTAHYVWLQARMQAGDHADLVEDFQALTDRMIPGHPEGYNAALDFWLYCGQMARETAARGEDPSRWFEGAWQLAERLRDIEPPTQEGALAFKSRVGGTFFRQAEWEARRGNMARANTLWQRAEVANREAFVEAQETLGELNASTIAAQNNLGGVLSRLERFDEAVLYNDDVVQKQRDRDRPSEGWRLGAFLVYYARALVGLERDDEAIDALREAIPLVAEYAATRDHHREALELLVTIHERRGEHAEAEVHRRQRLELDDD